MTAVEATPNGFASANGEGPEQATLPPPSDDETAKAESTNSSAPIPPYLPPNYIGFFENAKKDLAAFEGKLTSIPHPNQNQMLELLQKIRNMF